jgi:hypothetical protein
MASDSTINQLESRVRRLERQMEELTRLLKRVDDEEVKRAARRAQNA